MSVVPVKRALVSVHDKAGLVPFARRLVEAGVTLISSGGTARMLSEAGLPVTRVADLTGAPEMLGGRVKTLHPSIHGGILADLGDDAHRADLAARGIEPISLVVVNLYPFEATVADPDVARADAIENIDIGGPAMIRAAAKNHAWVGVVTTPDQYGDVAAAVETGGLPDDLREELATSAFFRTAAYDAAIVRWLESDEDLPERMVVPLRRSAELRYGENPQQHAAIYAEAGATPWWAMARRLQGKAMSFNNFADTEAAWRLVCDLADPAAVVVKHTNACGAAVAATTGTAFRKAWDCDPLSAFGGVIALNRPLDVDTATAIVANFVEVVVCPEVDPGAAEVMAAKKNVRLLAAPHPEGEDLDLRRIERGLLVQRRDRIVETSDRPPGGWSHVAGPEPSTEMLAGLGLAWTVCAHTKSNAIVVVRDGAAVGVGAGDQSRVGAAERALARAGNRAAGAVAASDAFLPFRDGLDVLADAGVAALVEPGGSMRDDEVIAAADERGVTLMFTGRRHFRH
jgi:phosphoribosylaminoimidazolecarboxamide formyltransferase/IMP cyclohydrolase